MEWEELSGNSDLWLPKTKMETIEGVVKEKKDNQYGVQVVLISKDNKEYVTPSHKVLQCKLSNVKVNDFIKIVYMGQELPKVKGQSGTMLYNVLRAK